MPYYSDQVTQLNLPDHAPLKANELGGAVRVAYFTIASTAGHLLNDTVDLFDLPAGARILIGSMSVSSSIGTTTVDIGTASDPDHYADGLTPTAGNAAYQFANTIALNLGEELTEETRVTLTYLTANPNSIAIKGFMLYVVD